MTDVLPTSEQSPVAPKKGSTALARAEARSKSRKKIDALKANGPAPLVVQQFDADVVLHLDPDQVVIDPDRLRQLDDGVAQAIAHSYGLVGQLQPGRVALDDDGVYHLQIGLHRLAGARLTGRKFAATAVRVKDYSTHQRRLAEIFENIIRPDLKALERAIFLNELKHVHEAVYPAARNGGDRRSAVAKAQRDQNEIFSFSSLAAERTGLTARAIEISVSIARKIPAVLQERIRGSWLADHQAGLLLLSQQTDKLQGNILDLLFAPVETRKVETVAEALALALGITVPRPADLHWQALTNKMARSTREQRSQLFAMYEDEIVAFVKTKGLV